MRGVVGVALPCLPISLLRLCLTYWELNPLGDSVTYRTKHPSRFRCRNARLVCFSLGRQILELYSVDGWNGDPGLVFIAGLQ
ncbi:hypothetical protein ASPBRDRAFT_40299 [Aspergillus brasiliensis CBS 101740]|uniref:Secreted protein n=1 Tax=Aspergillus brasiliensis (strain CBS 101740 / IMI 381727 / IBT 21946) TaxID=767769 RepID=A0A1L9UU26_ASPBC|nr:hypothetical protein ASPBRDRAFT_40299 [Aspergillus brasiliensis CBS 101740]